MDVSQQGVILLNELRENLNLISICEIEDLYGEWCFGLSVERKSLEADFEGLKGPEPWEAWEALRGGPLEQQLRKAASLVPEYRAFDAWAVPLANPDALDCLLLAYPKGSRFVRRKLVSWGLVRAYTRPNIDTELLRTKLTQCQDPCTFEGNFTEDTIQVCGINTPKDFIEGGGVILLGIPHPVEEFRGCRPSRSPQVNVARVSMPVVDLLVDNLLGSKVQSQSAGLALVGKWHAMKLDLTPE